MYVKVVHQGWLSASFAPDPAPPLDLALASVDGSTVGALELEVASLSKWSPVGSSSTSSTAITNKQPQPPKLLTRIGATRWLWAGCRCLLERRDNWYMHLWANFVIYISVLDPTRAVFLLGASGILVLIVALGVEIDKLCHCSSGLQLLIIVAPYPFYFNLWLWQLLMLSTN
jgi:hypothetical protein